MADALQTIIDQYLAHAEAAYASENFPEAYKLCLKMLEFDPENSATLEMKQKVEDAVENYNIHLIDKEIEKMQPLWKEERYEEIVGALSQLYKAQPNYTKLEKLLAEAEDLFRKQSEYRQKNSLTVYQKSLDDLLTQKKYNELLDKINETEKNYAGEIKVRKINILAKDKFVDAKISEKKELLDSEKYEEIVNFLYKLRYIHPASKKLEKLLRKYREKLLNQQIENKQDFIFRSKENIQNLIFLEKFEFAIEACEDMLRVDPRSLFAKKTILSCEAKLKKLLRNSMYNQITSKWIELSNDFRTNPETYIRI